MDRPRRSAMAERLWREWCFVRVVANRFWSRLLVVAAILVGGTMLASSYSKHIVVVGFGRLGYSTFRLLRKPGEPVVVIERDANNQFLEDLGRDGSPLHHSRDRRRPANLEAALFPGLDTHLERGDRVIVQGPFEVLHELQKQAMETV